jgi:hypothetical protein
MLWSISNSLLDNVSSWRNVVGRFVTFTSSSSSELVVGGLLAGAGSPVFVALGVLSVLLTGRDTSLLLLASAGSELLLGTTAGSELLLGTSAGSELLLSSSAGSKLLLNTAGFILLLSHDVGSFGGLLLTSDLILLSCDSLSLQLLLVGSNSLLNLLLGSSDNIVDLGSDLLNLLLSIETLSDLLVSLDETFKLLLEAVVLVVQVGHMFIEGINF